MYKLIKKYTVFTYHFVFYQRIGAIKDIEHSTLFLFSEGANWITGVTLVVDGGHWMNAAKPEYPEIILNPPKHRL
jgi:peroxisomal 2,4-dienoyl-CoA reductase